MIVKTQAIKDFKKVRRAFGTFQENFVWVYRILFFLSGIGSKIEQNLGKKKFVRYWRAVTKSWW